MLVNDDESGESPPLNDPPSPNPLSGPKVAQLPNGKPKTRHEKAPPKAPPSTPSVTSPSTPTTPESTADNLDKQPAAKPKIVPETPISTPDSSDKYTQNRPSNSSEQSSPHSSPPNAQDPYSWDWNIDNKELLDIPEQEFDLDQKFSRIQTKA